MSEKRLPEVQLDPAGFTPNYRSLDTSSEDGSGGPRPKALRPVGVVVLILFSVALIVTVVIGMVRH